MPLSDTPPDALARVYARSLYELAREQGGNDRVEEVMGELEGVVEIARADARFNEFLASRILASGERQAALSRIFEGRVSDTTLRFLLVLNRKGRLNHLLPIVAAFDEMVRELFGRVEVDVYTAEPMDESALETLRERLQRAMGRDPVLHAYVDPSMIGGVRLRIGDQLIDGSISTQLRRIRESLGSTGSALVRARASQILGLGLNGQAS